MTEKVIQVTSFIVTQDTITIYDENLKAHIFEQNSPEALVIEREVIPTFKKAGVAYFNPVVVDTYLTMFEAKSKLVKFFTVAKDKLKSYFNLDNTGRLTTQKQPFTKVQLSGTEKSDFSKYDGIHPREEDTVIGVVGDTIFPDIQVLKKHFMHANEMGTHANLDKLFERLVKCNYSKDYTVQDALSFLQKADLPITSTGDILCYRAVNQSQESSAVFVDRHSGRVKQWIGCRVQVPEGYVNTNRNVSCGQGLHVAAPQYMNWFSGDAIHICLLRPEDIGVIPHNEPQKVRVYAYHIVGVLTPEERHAIIGGKSFVLISDESRRKFQDIMNGKHINVTHTVTINGGHGTDIVTEAMNTNELFIANNTVTDFEAKTLEETHKELEQHKVEPNSLTSTPKTKKESMLELLPVSCREDALVLLLWKRKQKMSWSKLGVPSDQVDIIKSYTQDL